MGGASNNIWRSPFFWLTAGLVVTSDQITKAWIRSNLDLGDSVAEVGFFRLIHTQNTGGAFGLFPDKTTALIFAGFIAIVIIIGFVFLSTNYPLLQRSWSKIGIGLVLGGTLGNLIDRITRGFVTDFLDFNFWPAFNIADSALVTGSILLIILFLPQLFYSEKNGTKTI